MSSYANRNQDYAANAALVYRPADPVLNQGRIEIVFIESNLADYQALSAGFKPGVEVRLLDASQDGLQQMAAILQVRSGIDAIHIVSHGSEGQVQLGSLTLSNDNLDQQREVLAQIGAALTAEGDILLYGCEVSAGETGLNFIGKLAQITEADVAASTDLTGAAPLGGNWLLESSSGQIDTATLQAAEYAGVLASTLLYETTTPTFTGYTVNNAASFGSTTINRIGYRMEMSTTVGPTPYFAEVWFDAWSGVTAAGLAIPTGTNALLIQRDVTNLSVTSNYPGVTNGTGFSGRLEIWPSNYSEGLNGVYDYNDTGNSTSAGYGSFQVFNMTGTPQTVFAWNNHNVATPDLGFGNQPSGQPDWTFAGNTSPFSATGWKLQILADTAVNAAPTITGVTASTTINDTATATPFSGVTVADADANNVTVSVTLDTAAKGVFTAASLTASGFAAAGSGVYTLAAGTAAAATTAIRQLVFNPTDNRVAPASTETTTFTIAVNDGTATTSNATTTVVSTSVNDAPTLAFSNLSSGLTGTRYAGYFADNFDFFCDCDCSAACQLQHQPIYGYQHDDSGSELCRQLLGAMAGLFPRQQ